MAETLASLNIRIGADIRELEKGMRAAERTLRQTGRRLEEIGRSMSYAITAPMALIGGAAIKAAGDMEALKLAMQTTFQGAGRSIAEADKELEALRKSAQAPGLDFEQAVRASIKLQNVGFSAEFARKTIEELANAVATTGGTADDLGEVTNQFSQMIGKGKIFQDDLKIITARMPVVARIMKDTWGVTTAEGLNKANVSAKELIDTLVVKMSVMPRVAGGIANSIVNVGNSAKQFLASIGESLNQVGGIKGLFDGISASLDRWAAAFRAASPATKEFVFFVGLLLAAFGPLTYAISLAVKAAQIWTTVSIGMRIATLEVGAALSRARIAFLAMSAAAQSFILVTAVVAVAALITYFGSLEKQLTNTERAMRAVNSVAQEAAKNTVDQKVRVQSLTAVLNDQNATLKTKQNALDQLREISPKYFGGLVLAKGQVQGLTAATNEYNTALLRMATAQAAQSRLVDNQKKIFDLKAEQQAQLGLIDTIKAKALSVVAGAGAELAVMSQRNAAIQKDIDALDAETASLTGLIAKNADATLGVTEHAKATVSSTEKTDKLTTAIEKQNTVFAAQRLAAGAALGAIGGQFGQGGNIPGIPTLETPGDIGAPTVNEKNNPFKALTDAANEYNKAIIAAKASTQGFVLGIDPIKERMQTFASGIEGMGSAIGDALAGGAQSFKEFGKSALASAAQVVGALIKVFIAGLLAKSAIFAANPIIGLAIAASVGAIGSALFKRLVGGAKLAKGGVLTKPTMALMGEYPGASTNPEIVTPENKMREIFREGGGGGRLHGEIRVSGQDLLIALERAQQKNSRVRGY